MVRRLVAAVRRHEWGPTLFIFGTIAIAIIGAAYWSHRIQEADRRWVREQLDERGMTNCVEVADWEWVCDEGRSGMMLAK